MMKPQNTYPAASTIIDNARRLASDGQNTEYDRALVELTAVLTGMESSLAENHEVVDRIVLGRPTPDDRDVWEVRIRLAVASDRDPREWDLESMAQSVFGDDVDTVLGVDATQEKV